MVLSKQSIEKLINNGKLKISPFRSDCLDGCSYKLHIDDLAVFPDTGEEKKIGRDFYLMPNDFVLINTEEYLELPFDLIGHFTPRDRAARLGLLVNFGSELVKPGNIGKLCLDIKNLSSKPILLQKGLSLAKIYFELLDQETTSTANQHRNDEKPELSKLCEEMVVND